MKNVLMISTDRGMLNPDTHVAKRHAALRVVAVVQDHLVGLRAICRSQQAVQLCERQEFQD